MVSQIGVVDASIGGLRFLPVKLKNYPTVEGDIGLKGFAASTRGAGLSSSDSVGMENQRLKSGSGLPGDVDGSAAIASGLSAANSKAVFRSFIGRCCGWEITAGIIPAPWRLGYRKISRRHSPACPKSEKIAAGLFQKINRQFPCDRQFEAVDSTDNRPVLNFSRGFFLVSSQSPSEL